MSIMDKLVVWSLPLVPKPIVGYFSKNYIAGSRLEDAVRVVKELNAQDLMATIDLLGEEVEEKELALEAVEIYTNIINTIRQENLDANVSVKPTQMGLKIDKEFCFEMIKSLVHLAREQGTFVRIDMEDRTTTSDTIDIYLRLKKEYPGHVGTVVQAYLRRTSDDVRKLIHHEANLRLCKGIYNEPRDAAYKQMSIINENYKYILEQLLGNGCYVGIATHDEILVWHGIKTVEQLGLNKNQYEFQMLLGVDEKLREIIRNAGHRLRVYVPFGKDWYPYSTRRLKENPKMAGYIFKAIFGIGVHK